MPGSEEGVALRAGEVRPERLLETHLARILVSLETERAHGVLDVDAEGLCTTFYLREGAIVFAEGGVVGETLGRLLVRRGTITPAHYAAILRRMTDALVHDELMRFGEVAIELGVLSHEEVSAGLAAQVRERLIRCLQLERARWIFRDDPDATARVARFRCALAPALFESLSEPHEASRWPARLERCGRAAIALIGDATDVASQLGVGPGELRALRALDGTKRVDETVAPETPGAEGRAATIASLLLLGLAELREVTESTSSPSSVRRRSDETPGREPAENAARAALAAERLKQDIARRRLAAPDVARDETRSRLSAEQHYDAGLSLLRAGKLAAAQRDLTAACAAMPDAAEYRLAQTLVEWMLAEDAATRAARERVVRELIVETLRADKRSAIAHYAQGRVHAASEDHESAARAFAIAAKLDPTDHEAARWLRLSRGRVARR